MIVKNESHIIKRCLDSVKLLIDYVFIIDTGSSDNTIQEIENWISLNQINGEVISSPWKDFASNRSEALREMKIRHPHIDFSLMIDADEILIFDDEFDPTQFKSSLDKDFYDIVTNSHGTVYIRPTLTSNKVDFRYEGVVHEFLALDSPYSRGHAHGFYNRPIQDSNRNKSNKFLQDIEILENALKDKDVDFLGSRYRFYLAQSYKDSGQYEKAIENYRLRSTLGFWKEEEFISLYSIAKIEFQLGENYKALTSFLVAWNHSPHRLESLHGAIHVCRVSGWNNIGYNLGKMGITNLTYPEGSLFIESWIYDYGFMDEHSINCYYSGNIQEAKAFCQFLLRNNKIPDSHKERIKNNLNNL